MFFSVLLRMLLAVTAPVLGEVRVTQWPAEVRCHVGGSVTFYCSLGSDREEVADCVPYWYVPDPESSRPVLEVSRAKQYAGRLRVLEDPGNYTFLSLRGLQLNHSNTFYCRMSCHVAGKRSGFWGTGSTLNATDPPAAACGTGCGSSALGLVYFLFALNSAILFWICATVCLGFWRRTLSCQSEPSDFYAKPPKTARCGSGT